MSYMEIYNEEINDLLAPEHRKLQIHENIEVILILFSFFGWNFLSFGDIFVLIDILYNFSLKSQRGIYVAGLREEIVTSPEQVLDLMEFGECNFNFCIFLECYFYLLYQFLCCLNFRSIIWILACMSVTLHSIHYLVYQIATTSTQLTFSFHSSNLYQLIDTLERQIWICTVVDPILFFAW